MEAGDTLTVWTSLKANLGNCSQLERLVTGHSNVEHVTGRGGVFIRGEGPVLMAWPDMGDIGSWCGTAVAAYGRCASSPGTKT